MVKSRKGGFGSDARSVWHKIIDKDTTGLRPAEIESMKNYSQEIGQVLGKEDGSKALPMDSKIVGSIDNFPEIATAYSKAYQKSREKVGGKTRKRNRKNTKKSRKHRK